MKIAILSLGCPKNQVDADVYCRALIEAGHQTVPILEQAEAILVNTCGFIQSAKEEAIEAILDVCAMKRTNPALKVVVTGCLAERYREEVANEIPELDAVVGIGCNEDLPAILADLEAKEPAGGQKKIAQEPPRLCLAEKSRLPLGGPRVIGTPAHYAYLKIAEGCSNACSYCAIPLIRGPMRSRPLGSCLEEARWLAGQGVRELILVAQDLTSYGEDTGPNQLPQLLEQLDAIEGFTWIRLLYTYPERISPALLAVMANAKRILPYIDMPIQHINDEILRSMRRKGDGAAIRRAVQDVRAALPGAILRTSLIAGYPGETEEQFEELCAFVAEIKFDRLGCFAYSQEENTLAAALPGQLPAEECERRAAAVMDIQGRILAQKQEAMVGREVLCVCDSFDEQEQVFLCRRAADAPEIDTNLLVGKAAPLAPGQFFTARVTGTDGCDLTGDYLEARPAGDLME